MGVYTLKQYRALMKRRINALKQAGDRSSLSAASHQVMQAKRMAPRKTGTLIANIKKRHRKSGIWIAESWVPGIFKYNKFVNKSEGFRTLTYKNRNKRLGLMPGDKLIYGRMPAHWNWTGVPGYWNLASNMTRRMFGKTFRRNTLKALRVSV